MSYIDDVLGILCEHEVQQGLIAAEEQNICSTEVKLSMFSTFYFSDVLYCKLCEFIHILEVFHLIFWELHLMK